LAVATSVHEVRYVKVDTVRRINHSGIDLAARVTFDMVQGHDAPIIFYHVTGIPGRRYSQVVMDVKTGKKVKLGGWALINDYHGYVVNQMEHF
jgi:hypothetical protein